MIGYCYIEQGQKGFCAVIEGPVSAILKNADHIVLVFQVIRRLS